MKLKQQTNECCARAGWQTEDSLQKLPWKASSQVPEAVAKKSASLPENAMHHVQQNTGQVIVCLYVNNTMNRC